MDKYLARYAEEEASALTSFPNAFSFDHVVCIPAFKESTDFVERLMNLTQKLQKAILLILVVNQPDNCMDDKANHALINFLSRLKRLWAPTDRQQQLIHHDTFYCLQIDRYSQGSRIPNKQGVGLARKIAADCAAQLIQLNIIKDHQIFTTDADTILPTDYFSARLSPNQSAGVFPFKHKREKDPALDNATQVYEQSLHHYVEGIRQAGSPYAFYTIGSCLVVNAHDYCNVRGFPKKSGAEDFYLLNKLQKINPVITFQAPTLLIESRFSDRVPFGTGPAVRQLAFEEKPADALFYPQEAYEQLSHWLSYLRWLAKHAGFKSAEDYRLETAHALPPSACDHIAQTINKLQLEQTYQQFVKNFKTTSHREKALMVWFDALKTVKFIKHYPLIS